MLTECTTPSQCWRTIAQLARETGMGEDVIYKLARRVSAHEGTWVRKERMSPTHNKKVWWIDTEHPEYRAWLARKGIEPAPPEGADQLAALRQRIADGEPLSNSQAKVLLARMEEAELSLAEVLRQGEGDRSQYAAHKAGLEALLVTLRALGLSVFSDALDNAHANPLHWTWGALHGEGSNTLIEAVQAALHARLGPRRNDGQ